MNRVYCSQPLVLSIYNNFHNIVKKDVFPPQFSFALVRHASSSSVQTSGVSTPSTEEEQPKRKYVKPVDWLPFEWHRRPRMNYFADGGDLIKHLDYDPSWPKPDFEYSEELKTASDEVKYMFSLATAGKRDVKEVVRRRTLERIQRHPHDFESLEVQIALKTLMIRSLFDHSRECPKDVFGGRVMLEMLIKKRNRLLKILRIIDAERFNWICEELKLHYKPTPLGVRNEFYCKKWDLRRLTKEYCAKMVEDKKKAYHEELKKQQEEFLKEKAEILAWIEKEEKELANLTIQ